jgi:hypothetical protein
LSFSSAIFWAAEIDAMFSCSLCQKLQSDVTHHGCVSDNGASTGEEQIQVTAQFPGATEVERDVGTTDAFFGELPNNSLNGPLRGQQRL